MSVVRDLIFKLRILWHDIIDCCGDWEQEVWEKDLDSYHCCDAGFDKMCGCQGVTIREVYTDEFYKSSNRGDGQG